MSPSATSSLRVDFLDYLFAAQSGWLCIATQEPFDRTTFKQHFFQWPAQRGEIETFLDLQAPTKNIWFCINILAEPKRIKEHCLPTNLVWADVDDADISAFEPEPQALLKTSQGRFQAIWRLDRTVQPYLAEEYSRRVAYAVGADKSGWDLTQLLRMPFTKNLKYEQSQEVELVHAYQPMLPMELFEAVPPVPLVQDAGVETEFPMPKIEELPDGVMVLYKYNSFYRATGLADLISREPNEGDDWSIILWRILNIGFESGATREEVFALALHSNFNKYERDGRSPTYLWRDVCKAELKQKRIELVLGTNESFEMPQLVDASTLPTSIISDYCAWATEATDAVPVYHELCGFMILSSILSANLQLGLQYGAMRPHLWAMILGNSTLTRKTTAMNLATAFISQIDRDILLASDGSAEGILSGLALRNGEAAIFYKDEVTGLFDAIKHKEYLAGLPEMFTGLYDSPPFYARRLRKETITVLSPIFMCFMGGIKDRMYELIDDSMVLSGFMPRFLVVNGTANLNTIRVTGPPTEQNQEKRQALLERFLQMWRTYHTKNVVEIIGQKSESPSMYEVLLTPDAWKFYQEIEVRLIETAQNTNMQMIALPTFERLSRSCLKMATLLAAARAAPQENYVQCTLTDVQIAASYIQRWGNHSIDMLQNIGRPHAQRTLDKILVKVTAHPGILRGVLMRELHISSRDMTEIQKTLEERGQIITQKSGRGYAYFPVGAL